ncbi:hypothetical protein CU040_2498 [Enterococcus faecium]|nr:hypothetical protein [Enterococcus faecium]
MSTREKRLPVVKSNAWLKKSLRALAHARNIAVLPDNCPFLCIK